MAVPQSTRLVPVFFLCEATVQFYFLNLLYWLWATSSL